MSTIITPSSTLSSSQVTLTPTTSSATTTTPICANQVLDSTCSYFSSTYDYCNKKVYLNGILFSQACLKTCNLCPTQEQTNCTDSQANCISWANYCYLLADKKPHPCPKTCGVCPTKPAITTTTIATTAICVDAQTTVCSAWASYCDILKDLKPHPCAKTCNKC